MSDTNPMNQPHMAVLASAANETEKRCNTVARLIDADELLKHKGDLYDKDGHLIYAVGTGDILAAKTIDAEPVRYAHWVWDENGYNWGLPAWVCSACNGRNNNIPPYTNVIRAAMNPYLWSGAQYCPTCGAKMTRKDESNVPEVH